MYIYCTCPHIHIYIYIYIYRRNVISARSHMHGDLNYAPFTRQGHGPKFSDACTSRVFDMPGTCTNPNSEVEGYGIACPQLHPRLWHQSQRPVESSAGELGCIMAQDP